MARKGGHPKDPRTTNESCWKANDDNLIPNPPLDASKYEKDEVDDEATAGKKHDTKVIMAHEFREHPDGFKAIAKAVADSYNEAHELIVGEDLPEQLEKKTEWVFDPLRGYEEKEKKDE